MQDSPLAILYYRLARTFGWPPDVIRGLTPAEAGIYLDMVLMDKNDE